MNDTKFEPRDHPLARVLYEVIFEADTFWGKLFDLLLLAAILVSVTAVCMETVEPYGDDFGTAFSYIEWTCTVLFTLEYVIRVACLKQPMRYVFSFFGIVDLLSFLPSYISGPAERSSFAVLRLLRLLRVFRILELGFLESEANSLRRAVWEARAKIAVFFVTVLIIVTIAGAAMYEIERHASVDSDFPSIPQAVYWAVITMTTVGYGDMVPHSAAGKVVAALLVLLGYSLIIVPTGFVSAELTGRQRAERIDCPACAQPTHRPGATHCDRCGTTLPSTSQAPRASDDPGRTREAR